MHYNKDYSKYITLHEKDKAALADIKEYVGSSRLKDIIMNFKLQPKSKMPFERFEMYMSIAGIAGYPVIALYNNIYAEDQQ